MDSKKLKTDQPKTKAGQTRSLDIANLLFGFQTFYFSFVICNDGSIVDISRFLCVFFLIDGNFLDFFRLKRPVILLLRGPSLYGPSSVDTYQFIFRINKQFR